MGGGSLLQQQILPGYVWRGQGPAVWSQYLTVTEESFGLMIEWQSIDAKRKPPQLRRKFDRAQIEEGANLVSLVLSLKMLTMSEHPSVSASVFDASVIQPFKDGHDANMMVCLQGLLHSKPAKIDLTDVPAIADLISRQVASADMALFGVDKTVLINAEIEKTDFVVFTTRLQYDVNAYQNYFRNVR